MDREKGYRVLLTAALACAALLAPAGSASASADRLVYNCGNDICVMDPAVPFQATNLTQTTPTQTVAASETYPSFSPDGTKIAFAGLYGSSWWEVYTMPANSTPGAAQVTNVSHTSPERTVSSSIAPQWSPDGQYLAWTGHYNSNAPPNLGDDINVGKADGTTGTPTNVGSTSDQENHPSWSPNGQTIVFGRRGNGLNGVYTAPANTNSTTGTALTGGGLGFAPSYSPDGTKIAFIYSGFGPSPSLVKVANADGSGTPVTLGQSTGIIDNVVWSPDSKRVAWIYAFEKTVNVRVADGSAPAVPIPATAALNPQNVQWSPDGTMLSFNSYDAPYDYQQLFIAKSDGSAQATAITNTRNAESMQATWLPRAVSGPPPTTPDNPEDKPRQPASFNLANFKATTAYNPFRLIVSINCHVEGYPPSNHPACKAYGDGKARGQSTGLRVTGADGKPKGKLISVVSAKASIPAGAKGKLKFKVTKKGRKLLKPGKVVKVKLTIKVTQAGNETATKTINLKLKAPGKKK